MVTVVRMLAVGALLLAFCYPAATVDIKIGEFLLNNDTVAHTSQKAPFLAEAILEKRSYIATEIETITEKLTARGPQDGGCEVFISSMRLNTMTFYLI